MADLTLVNLNLLYIRHYDRVDEEMHVPLGCLYLVRALEDAGLSVDFRDFQRHGEGDPFAEDALVRFLEDRAPAPVIGLSVMANLLPFVLLAARRVRERWPDRTIVLGGTGPKAVEEGILAACPWIDVIAVGEGEVSAPRLAAALRDGLSLDDVPGIVWRRDGEIATNSPAPRICDLDAIPFPAFDRIDLPEYAGYGVMTSRGCPYPCTFCSVAPVWDRKSFLRSPTNIIAEMRDVHERTGADLFLFQDEFFVSSKKNVLAFCEEFRASGLPVTWKAFGRVNLTDEATMRAMADAGCTEVRYGIESGSPRILKRIKKGFSAEDSVRVVADAVRIFPHVDTFFIWGYPFEEMEDFHQTVFQMTSFRAMGARVLPSLLCFLPQTDIYLEYRDSDRFEFCTQLLPEFMVTGHEVCNGARVAIKECHQPIFDYVARHRKLFPGFFHYDLENNVLPKLKVLQEFGFYGRDVGDTGLETRP